MRFEIGFVSRKTTLFFAGKNFEQEAAELTEDCVMRRPDIAAEIVSKPGNDFE